MVGAVHLLHMQWQPTQQSPPLPFMWGNCPLTSSAQACILQLFQAYHSKSVFSQVYRYLPHLSITRVTKAQLFSHQRITTTRWSATSHLKSVNACLWTQHSPSSVSTMLGPEWFIKPHTKAYNTPSNGYSKCDSHYMSISMWSRDHHSSKSLLIQELCLPSVPQ